MPATTPTGAPPTAAVAAALAGVTFLAFGRMVWEGHPFIHLDDWQYVVQNPNVRSGLSLENLRWAFHPGTFVANNWHPVTLVSHMVDSTLFGLERPWGHHLTSLLLHAANAVLVFLLLLRSTGALWASALVAALFAWHPTRVESVAWVAERKDVLCGFFALLSIAAYGAWVRRPGSGRYALLLVSFALGLMAKSMLVTLPFALLLLDVWPLGRLRLARGARSGNARVARRLVVEKLPLFALTAAFTVMAFVSQATTGAVADLERVPPLARIANAATSCWAYVGMLVWPAHLAVMYPITGRHLTIAGTAFALAALMAATLFAWRMRERHAFVPVGWAWYLGTLVPVIGLVQLGSQAMADRYLYLPALGLFAITAFGLREIASARPRWRTPIGAASGSALAAFAALTFVQTGHWRSTETLFRHNLAVAGANDIVWSALAVAYDEAGEPDRALEAYRHALESDPASATAHLAIGSLRLRQGSWLEAAASLQRAIDLGAGAHDVRVHLWLGDALRQQRRDAEAAAQYALVVERDPAHLQARLRHALALEAAGRPALALASLDATLRSHPRALEPRVLAARLLATPDAPHDPRRAVRLAESVLADAPVRKARYTATLARAYAAAGRHDEATAAGREALERARQDGDGALALEIEAWLERRAADPSG
jgi:tetratricopeptide (TPR) repeat protein